MRRRELDKVNKCHFLGKITYNPEIHHKEGVPVVLFELEVEEFRKDSNGEKIRTATYLNCEAWDSAALAISKYAECGSLMAVEAIARNSLFTLDGVAEDILETYFRVTNFKILHKS